jgi:hypothetical protein
MSKHKAGLRKEISTIFKGIPIQEDGTVGRPPGAPVPQRPHYEQRPQQDREKEKGPLEPAFSPKPPVSSQPPASTAEPKQPAPSVKTAPPPRLKAQPAVKTKRQMPWQKTFEQVKNKLFKPKAGVSAARQKAMTLSVPVLFIILTFAFVQVFNTSSRKTAGAHQINLSNATAGSDNEINWQIPELYPGALRDPTQFGSTTAAQTQGDGLIVRGIVYSQDRPTAVIGTQIVREGDKVLDATVIKINRDSVEFESDGRRWTQKVQR